LKTVVDIFFFLQIQTRSNTHEKTKPVKVVVVVTVRISQGEKRISNTISRFVFFYSINLPLPANKKSETFIVETLLLLMQLPRWKYKNVKIILFVFFILIKKKNK
jgi:hypothetical protein